METTSRMDKAGAMLVELAVEPEVDIPPDSPLLDAADQDADTGGDEVDGDAADDAEPAKDVDAPWLEAPPPEEAGALLVPDEALETLLPEPWPRELEDGRPSSKVADWSGAGGVHPRSMKRTRPGTQRMNAPSCGALTSALCGSRGPMPARVHATMAGMPQGRSGASWAPA